jgi:hypothetical protein
MPRCFSGCRLPLGTVTQPPQGGGHGRKYIDRVHGAAAPSLTTVGTAPSFLCTQTANMKNDEGEVVDLYIPRKWCVCYHA